MPAATRDSRIRIVIEVQNNAAGELRKVTGELNQVSSATNNANNKSKSFMQTIGGIKTSMVAAGAAIAGAALAIKKVWDFAEEGAGIERLQIATTNLADSMGGDMSRIVSAVRAASQGTVSDYAIMQASGRAMMLGLGADADKLANLMQVAMFRGRAMGLSSEQAFSDIVTGVGRMSPLILDNLGIVLDAEKTYADYAAAIGKTAESLSGAEKRQALLNRVLEEGNRMMQEAGGLGNDTATAYERMGAAFQNAGNRMKAGLGNAFEPVANAIANAVGYTENLTGQMAALKKEIEATAASYDEYYTQLENGAAQAGLMVDAQGRLVQTYRTASGRPIHNVIDANYLLSRSYRDVMETIDQIPDDPFVEKQKRGRVTYSQNVQRFIIQPEDIKQMGNLSFHQAAVAFSAAETTRKMSELQLFMQGPVRQADEAYIQRSQQLQAQLAETGKKLELLRKTPWKKEDLAETEQQYAGIQTQITQNAEDHTRASKQILFDLASQRMAQDGLTQAEADAQVALAEKFGLIDEKTAEMWKDIQGPVDSMSAGKLTADGWLATMESIATKWTVVIEWVNEGTPPPQSIVPKSASANGGGKAEQQYATGGSFIVPGTGGIDSQRVSFRATPGEEVTIAPPGKAGRGGMVLKNYGNIYVGSLDEFANYGV